MKYFIIIFIIFYNINTFSQNKIIIDSVYICQIINDNLKKTIDQFFLYEDSVWGYNQYNKTFAITIETIKEHEIENLDSVTSINYVFCLTSGYTKNTFKYYYSSNDENPTIYYVTYYNNRKIVFLLDSDSRLFFECIVKCENKIAVKVYPIEMNKYRRKNAIQRRSYVKFFYNENCELSSKLVWRNYKDVPLELRKY